MSGADERLVVMLEARITEFERRMQQAERRGTRTYDGLRRSSRSATRAMEADMLRSTSAINRALAATSSKMGTFAKAFAGGAAVGAAGFITSAMTTNIAETVKGIASIGDEAKRAGIGLEAFQEWKFVAEQNRIGVDSLVDGFKELSLRADEFIATGKGPAEEAFRRIGYTGEALSKALKDPSELMVEIIGRMEGLDKAAQIRVADEIFGGTAGERFVELLAQGREGIERTIQGAHEAGAVLDAEMIAKADELDRKFTQLQVSAGNFFKTVTVEAAGALSELFDGRTSLEMIFGDTAGAEAALGSLYERLAENRDMADQGADSLVALRQAQEGLIGPASSLSEYFGILETRFRNMGETDLASGIADLRAELDDSIRAFEQSEISAADFEVKLQDVEASAYDVIAPLEGINASRFVSVTAELGGLFGALASVRDVARQAWAAVASLAGVDAGSPQAAMRTRQNAEAESMASLENMRKANNDFLASEKARNEASSEQLKLQREIEDTRKRASEAGASLTAAEVEAAAQASIAGDAARMGGGRSAGGGGGSPARSGGGGGAVRDKDEYASSVEKIREEIAALEAEAASLIAVADSGKQYADALEFARTRAALLHKAQQQGKALTPELRAEVDQLAEAYVTAGANAEEAADRLDKIRDQSEQGKQALSDLFGSVIDGSMSAKDAVANLLLEIVKIQALNSIMGIPGMGGIASTIGGLLTPKFAAGGFHDGGLRIVGERGPELEATGPSRIWTAEQTRKMLNPQQGQGTARQTAPQDVNVTVRVDQNGNLQAFVDKRAGAAAMAVGNRVRAEVPGIMQNYQKRQG